MLTDEAIAEARENVERNWTTEPCVVKHLLAALDYSEKRAGQRWHALDAEKQDHALTRRQLAELAQAIRDSGGYMSDFKNRHARLLSLLPNKAYEPPR